MKLLLLLLACLVACFVAADDAIPCPVACECPEEGNGPYLSRCSTLNPEQKFDDRVTRLVIENDQNLVLSKNIFETIGLQNVLRIRIVNCTIANIDARAFSNLKYLTTIEFVSNQQLTIDPDAFNTTSLIQLVLRNNIINFSRKVDYFFDVPELRELEISGAELTELPSGAFSKIPKVQYISLASNHLRNLGNEFIQLVDLEEVDLSNNDISEIGVNVFENKLMNVLKLHNNPMTTMAGVQLPFLTDLDVSFCKFSSIDKTTFSGLSSLYNLNLSGNALQNITEDTFLDENMSNLANLDLSYNNLKGPLPKNLFGKIEGLKVVVLSHNPSLQILDKDFFKGLNEIIKLDLSFCGLKTIDDSLFRDLVKLSQLNLAGNLIQRLKPGVLNKYISRLDLSHNTITHLDDIKFASNSRLKKLYLSGNKLSFISTSSLADLTKLEVLDLSSCSLTSFWDLGDQTPVLPSLTTLVIADNLIPIINEEQLRLTPNLVDIDLKNNPLSCDDIFADSLKWLKKNRVKPYITSKSASLSLSFNPQSEDISPLGWGAFKEQICGDREREKLLQNQDKDIQKNIDQLEDDEQYENEDDEDDEDDEDEEDEEYEEADPSDSWRDDTDRIVLRKHEVIKSESNDNDLGYFLMILFSVVTILISVVILAAFVLRWSRQRNSYGARMISTHLHHPKMKRDRSSLYQQLFEDPNHPTTPVMTAKSSNQTQYNFPDAQGNKQYGYITYLSKDFNDTTVIPQSV